MGIGSACSCMFLKAKRYRKFILHNLLRLADPLYSQWRRMRREHTNPKSGSSKSAGSKGTKPPVRRAANFSRIKYRFLAILSILGPGFITANVDNDPGGIFADPEVHECPVKERFPPFEGCGVSAYRHERRWKRSRWASASAAPEMSPSPSQ